MEVLSKRSILIAFPVALAILALVIGVGGCGGDDGGTTADTVATSNLTKQQFLKRANQICVTESTKTLGKLTAYEESHTGGDPKIAFGKAIKVVVPEVLEPQVDQIRDLGAPEGLEVQVEAFLDALESEMVEIEEAPPVKTSAALNGQFTKSSALAKQLGLTSCAYG